MMHIETEYNEPNSHKLNATALQLNKPVRKEWGLPPAWLIMDEPSKPQIISPPLPFCSPDRLFDVCIPPFLIWFKSYN